MIAALLASRRRDTLFLLGVGLIAIVGATAHSTVRLNGHDPFYDALAHKNLPRVRSEVDRLRRASCRAQRRADVAHSEIEARFAREPCRGSPGRMAIAAARLSSVACPRDRRQSRSTDS